MRLENQKNGEFSRDTLGLLGFLSGLREWLSLKHILFVNQDKTFRKVSGLRSLGDGFHSGSREVLRSLGTIEEGSRIASCGYRRRHSLYSPIQQ
jgi:hypothetical protein